MQNGILLIFSIQILSNNVLDSSEALVPVISFCLSNLFSCLTWSNARSRSPLFRRETFILIFKNITELHLHSATISQSSGSKLQLVFRFTSPKFPLSSKLLKVLTLFQKVRCLLYIMLLSPQKPGSDISLNKHSLLLFKEDFIKTLFGLTMRCAVFWSLFGRPAASITSRVDGNLWLLYCVSI